MTYIYKVPVKYGKLDLPLKTINDIYAYVIAGSGNFAYAISTSPSLCVKGVKKLKPDEYIQVLFLFACRDEDIVEWNIKNLHRRCLHY